MDKRFIDFLYSAPDKFMSTITKFSPIPVNQTEFTLLFKSIFCYTLEYYLLINTKYLDAAEISYAQGKITAIRKDPLVNQLVNALMMIK